MIVTIYIKTDDLKEFSASVIRIKNSGTRITYTKLQDTKKAGYSLVEVEFYSYDTLFLLGRYHERLISLK